MADDKNFTIDTDDTVMFKERKRLLFLGLPWTFTKYTITPSLLTIDRGLLSTTEDDCYMYKIQDVKLTTSLLERIVGLGTITCYTGDVTDAELKLIHVRKGYQSVFIEGIRSCTIKETHLKHNGYRCAWCGFRLQRNPG